METIYHWSWSKQHCIWSTSGPNIGMFVLLLMHFQYWFQLSVWNSRILTFLKKILMQNLNKSKNWTNCYWKKTCRLLTTTGAKILNYWNNNEYGYDLARGWFNTSPCRNALPQPSICQVPQSTCTLHVTLCTKCEFFQFWNILSQ